MARRILFTVMTLVLMACGSEPESETGSEAPKIEAVAPRSGEPLRWVVRDEDSTLILVPTIHILPPELDWMTEGLEAALDASDQVWFEVEPSAMSDAAQMQTLMQRYGVDPATPLSQRLGEEDYARVAETARSLGMPPEQLEPMRPWLAAQTLTYLSLVQSGFDPSAGVEKVLAEEVRDDKERGLETVEEQLSFLAGMPEAVQVDLLLSTVEEIEGSAAELRRLAEGWAEGDLSELEALMVTDIKAFSKELYDVLIVKRNQAWAERLSAELGGSGVDTVAVGAGHLVGEDGLPTLLADRGYQVEGPLP